MAKSEGKFYLGKRGRNSFPGDISKQTRCASAWNDADQSWCAGNVSQVCRDSDHFSRKGSWAGPGAHRDPRQITFVHKRPHGYTPECHINAIFYVLHNVKKVEKLIFRWSLPEVDLHDYSVRIKDIINSSSFLLMKLNNDVIIAVIFLKFRFRIWFCIYSLIWLFACLFI